MKRDDDLIRDLLFEAEAADQPRLLVSTHLSSPLEERRRHEHALLLCDAGFFQEISKDVFRITNQGHDYLAAIRDDGVWQKTKEAASTAGGVGLGVMKDIAVAYVKEELSARLGLPL
ncbi:DUF2513 domain-containing protein [Paracoccus aestuarii]|uniref:DUF2513 domain-containing protein n=1 Tax=Paracoccus aestuarii TaxID=453842 RepID=A0A418ZVR1_9RHOB|nr:DUF2513 domain-containing protein [Paracoccus aestuarii]RJL03325.1 DUF2513 domain-containing protein [Paracoccus aestuarii]WCR01347.1 DUF2513 domain-containing protein [Paracoccus aestuarii]